MPNDQLLYKPSFILAATLHVIVFVLVFAHFMAPHTHYITQPAVAIVHATLAEPQPVKPLPPTPVVMPQPIQHAVAKEPPPLPLPQPQQQQPAQAKAAVVKAQQEKQKVAAHKVKEEQRHQQEARAHALAEKQRQQALQTLLQQQLATEQKQLAQAANAAQVQGVVDKYKAMIIQAIAVQWIVPDSANNALSCQLLVRLAPGGVVVDVDLLKSSGDAVLDRSARTAVFKASPLPVPPDPALFDNFRVLRLTVRPEGIM